MSGALEAIFVALVVGVVLVGGIGGAVWEWWSGRVCDREAARRSRRLPAHVRCGCRECASWRRKAFHSTSPETT